LRLEIGAEEPESAAAIAPGRLDRAVRIVVERIGIGIAVPLAAELLPFGMTVGIEPVLPAVVYLDMVRGVPGRVPSPPHAAAGVARGLPERPGARRRSGTAAHTGVVDVLALPADRALNAFPQERHRRRIVYGGHRERSEKAIERITD